MIENSRKLFNKYFDCLHIVRSNSFKEQKWTFHRKRLWVIQHRVVHLIKRNPEKLCRQAHLPKRIKKQSQFVKSRNSFILFAPCWAFFKPLNVIYVRVFEKWLLFFCEHLMLDRRSNLRHFHALVRCTLLWRYLFYSL